MKIGDKVSVIDDDLKGTILKIIADQVKIEDEHGFTYDLPKSQLTILDSGLYENTPVIRKNESSKNVSKKHNKTPLKLDLHFQLLVKNPSDYDAFERLMIQKDKLLETIDFCRKNHIKNLEIIHGIGDGVLQKMVYDILEGLSNVEYDEHGFFYHESGKAEVKFL
ncbi:Smr/MutS family protein [Epilithonimonas tenax]|uniref:Smr/MutS family protein n=1 Tax=Epilithonimonas tenax TaxID=191577 RepID=UPI0003FB829D|nr:Smr/MutS family protein [Epilithonimonas tenax]